MVKRYKLQLIGGNPKEGKPSQPATSLPKKWVESLGATRENSAVEFEWEEGSPVATVKIVVRS